MGGGQERRRQHGWRWAGWSGKIFAWSNLLLVWFGFVSSLGSEASEDASSGVGGSIRCVVGLG